MSIGFLPGIRKIHVECRSVTHCKTRGNGLLAVGYVKPPSPYDSFCQKKLNDRLRTAKIAAFAASLPPPPKKQHARKTITKIATAKGSFTHSPQGKITSCSTASFSRLQDQSPQRILSTILERESGPIAKTPTSPVTIKPKRAGFYRPASFSSPAPSHTVVIPPKRDCQIEFLPDASIEMQKLSEGKLLAHFTPQQLIDRRARQELFRRV
jgi:hypothetical protein